MAPLAIVALAGATLGIVAARQPSGDRGPAAIVPAHRGPFRGNTLPRGLARKRAPDFRLRDARGGSLDTRDLRGGPYALTFLYVNCPDVCPLIADELRQALELTGGRRDKFTVVAVSVDPRGDTPEAVQAWAKRHRLPDNFHYLIGSEREMKPVWDAYYAAPQTPGRPESAHTASIWLVDSAGRWRTKFSAGFPVPPRDLAHDFRLLLRDAG